MLPPERVQEIAWNGTQQSQCSIGELRELCRGYLANLETQEWLIAHGKDLWASGLPTRTVMRLRGTPIEDNRVIDDDKLPRDLRRAKLHGGR